MNSRSSPPLTLAASNPSFQEIASAALRKSSYPLGVGSGGGAGGALGQMTYATAPAKSTAMRANPSQSRWYRMQASLLLPRG